MGGMTRFAGPLAAVMGGHALLLACSVLYLAWWSMFFRPGIRVAGAARVVGAACIVVAAFCGLAGLVIAGSALPRLESAPTAEGVVPHIPLWPVVLGGIVAYCLLAGVTGVLLHRPITTELLLIDLWTTFEVCTIIALSRSASLSPVSVTVLSVVVAVFCIIGLLCYMLYYRLSPIPAFIDGMAPLVAVGIEAVIVIVLLLV